MMALMWKNDNNIWNKLILFLFSRSAINRKSNHKIYFFIYLATEKAKAQTNWSLIY